MANQAPIVGGPGGPQAQTISFVVRFADTQRAEALSLPSTSTVAAVKRVVLGQEAKSEDGKDDKEEAEFTGELILNGKPLQDKQTLAEAGVQQESVLVFESGVSGKDAIAMTSACQYEAVAFDKQKEEFLVMVSMKAPAIEDVKRVPIDLVLVVDRSGSMCSMMGLVIETVEFIIKEMQAGDRLSVVDYDDRITTLVPLIKMTSQGKNRASKAAKTLSARGGTNLSGGLFRGLQVLQESIESERNEVSSVLLFTDGQANSGIQDQTSIIRAMLNPNYIKDFNPNNNSSNSYGNRRSQQYGNRSQRVPPGPPPMMQQQQQQQPAAPHKRQPSLFSSFIPSFLSSSTPSPPTPPTPPTPPADTILETGGGGETTDSGNSPNSASVFTFGFGSNHNEDLLKGIAEAGAGLYFYIENKEAIGDAFVDCVGGLLSVVGQNLELTIAPAPNSKVELLEVITQYPKTTQGNATVLKIKDIQSEESRDLLCRVRLPAISQATHSQSVLTATLSYDNLIAEKKHQATTTSTVSRPAPDAKELAAQVANVEVDKHHNRLKVAAALEAATAHGDGGRLSEAKAELNRVAASIKNSPSYAIADNAYAQELFQQCEEAVEGLSSQEHYRQHTSKAMKMQCKSHFQQRSVASPAMASSSSSAGASKASAPRLNMYGNSKKKKMKSSYTAFKSAS